MSSEGLHTGSVSGGHLDSDYTAQSLRWPALSKFSPAGPSVTLSKSFHLPEPQFPSSALCRNSVLTEGSELAGTLRADPRTVLSHVVLSHHPSSVSWLPSSPDCWHLGLYCLEGLSTPTRPELCSLIYTPPVRVPQKQSVQQDCI